MDQYHFINVNQIERVQRKFLRYVAFQKGLIVTALDYSKLELQLKIYSLQIR